MNDMNQQLQISHTSHQFTAHKKGLFGLDFVGGKNGLNGFPKAACPVPFIPGVVNAEAERFT